VYNAYRDNYMLDYLKSKDVVIYTDSISSTVLYIKSPLQTLTKTISATNFRCIVGAKFTFSALYDDVYRIYVSSGHPNVDGAANYKIIVLDVNLSDLNNMQIVNEQEATVSMSNINNNAGFIIYPCPTNNYLCYGTMEGSRWYNNTTNGPIKLLFREDGTLSSYQNLGICMMQYYSGGQAKSNIHFEYTR